MESVEIKKVKRRENEKAKKRESKRNSSKRNSKTLLPDLSLLEVVDPPPVTSPTTTTTTTTTTSGASTGTDTGDESVSNVMITLTRSDDASVSTKMPSPGRIGEKSHSSSSGSTNDQLTTSSSSTSASREKLIYKPHRDGYLNENRLPFDDVNFCFVCDTVDPDIVIGTKTSLSTVAIGQRNNNTSSQSLSSKLPKRPRSASAITSSSITASMILSGKLGSLKRTIVKTSYKFTGEPIYRTVFLCPKCLTVSSEEREKDKEYSLRISERALTYF